MVATAFFFVRFLRLFNPFGVISRATVLIGRRWLTLEERRCLLEEGFVVEEAPFL